MVYGNATYRSLYQPPPLSDRRGTPIASTVVLPALFISEKLKCSTSRFPSKEERGSGGGVIDFAADNVRKRDKKREQSIVEK